MNHKIGKSTPQYIRMKLRNELQTNTAPIFARRHYSERPKTMFQEIYKESINNNQSYYQPKHEDEAKLAVSIFVDGHLNGDHTKLKLNPTLKNKLDCFISNQKNKVTRKKYSLC